MTLHNSFRVFAYSSIHIVNFISLLYLDISKGPQTKYN